MVGVLDTPPGVSCFAVPSALTGVGACIAGAGRAGLGGGGDRRLFKNPITLLLLMDCTCCQPQAVGADHQTCGLSLSPHLNTEKHQLHG